MILGSQQAEPQAVHLLLALPQTALANSRATYLRSWWHVCWLSSLNIKHQLWSPACINFWTFKIFSVSRCRLSTLLIFGLQSWSKDESSTPAAARCKFWPLFAYLLRLMAASCRLHWPNNVFGTLLPLHLKSQTLGNKSCWSCWCCCCWPLLGTLYPGKRAYPSRQSCWRQQLGML